MEVPVKNIPKHRIVQKPAQVEEEEVVLEITELHLQLQVAPAAYMEEVEVEALIHILQIQDLEALAGKALLLSPINCFSLKQISKSFKSSFKLKRWEAQFVNVIFLSSFTYTFS
jgi:hypothetical protein